MSENEDKEKNVQKQKKSGVFSTLILIIAIGVFIFSGYQLWLIFSEYNEGLEEYTKIEDEVVDVFEVEEDVEAEESGAASDEPEKKSRQVLDIDFNTLKNKNKDVIGWIHFEEPKVINYPILYGVDNNKYLKKTLEGKRNSAGSIFTDYRNNKDFSDKNTFIYGHNMKNGTMFWSLRKFKNEDYRNSNPYFYIYTPDGKETTYEIFATCVVQSGSDTYDVSYENNEDFMKYVGKVRSKALYQTNVEVKEEDSIITLSTCTNRTDTERLVVHGVKVSELNISNVENN